MHALALLLLSVVPQPGGALVDRVDLIELNHYYDEQGRHVFDQLIFYDWSGRHSRFMVRDWRLVKSIRQLPSRDFPSGGWVAVWQDGDVLRRVWANSYRETLTQYDPELEEREYLHKDDRRKLSPAPRVVAAVP